MSSPNTTLCSNTDKYMFMPFYPSFLLLKWPFGFKQRALINSKTTLDFQSYTDWDVLAMQEIKTHWKTEREKQAPELFVFHHPFQCG